MKLFPGGRDAVLLLRDAACLRHPLLPDPGRGDPPGVVRRLTGAGGEPGAGVEDGQQEEEEEEEEEERRVIIVVIPSSGRGRGDGQLCQPGEEPPRLSQVAMPAVPELATLLCQVSKNLDVRRRSSRSSRRSRSVGEGGEGGGHEEASFDDKVDRLFK